MPVRTPQDLTQSLKQGKLQPVYFLFGPESYLRNQAVNVDHKHIRRAPGASLPVRALIELRLL